MSEGSTSADAAAETEQRQPRNGAQTVAWKLLHHSVSAGPVWLYARRAEKRSHWRSNLMNRWNTVFDCGSQYQKHSQSCWRGRSLKLKMMTSWRWCWAPGRRQRSAERSLNWAAPGIAGRGRRTGRRLQSSLLGKRTIQSQETQKKKYGQDGHQMLQNQQFPLTIMLFFLFFKCIFTTNLLQSSAPQSEEMQRLLDRLSDSAQSSGLFPSPRLLAGNHRHPHLLHLALKG